MNCQRFYAFELELVENQQSFISWTHCWCIRTVKSRDYKAIDLKIHYMEVVKCCMKENSTMPIPIHWKNILNFLGQFNRMLRFWCIPRYIKMLSYNIPVGNYEEGFSIIVNLPRILRNVSVSWGSPNLYLLKSIQPYHWIPIPEFFGGLDYQSLDRLHFAPILATRQELLLQW